MMEKRPAPTQQRLTGRGLRRRGGAWTEGSAGTVTKPCHVGLETYGTVRTISGIAIMAIL
jgi:hypothetical protein